MATIKKDGLYRVGDISRTGSQFQYFAGTEVDDTLFEQLEYVGEIPDKTIDRTTDVDTKAQKAAANKAEPAPENKKA